MNNSHNHQTINAYSNPQNRLQICIEQKYKSLNKKILYVVKNFLSIYEIGSDVQILFGDNLNNNNIQIKPGKNILDFFSSRKTVPEFYIFKDWNNKKVPFFFTNEEESDIININEKKIRINFDLFSSAFYLLSCWQEWMINTKDKLGRFPAKESFLFKHNLLQIPVVNYYFAILKTAIEKYQKYNQKDKIISLGSNNISCLITHDIDKCKTGWKENSARAFIEGHPIVAFKTIFNKIFNKDTWFNFEQILYFEEKYNIKSTYFFNPRKSRSRNIGNADYELNSDEMIKILDKLSSNKHEIGIHGSLNSGFNKKNLSEDIRNFPLQPIGNRFHFLAFNIPQSFDILELTNLKYDSSLGFAEKIGFRSGYCYPYRPYDINNNRPYTFWEFPLMIMDTTLANKKYMNTDFNIAYEFINNIINEVDLFNGTLVLLWHNSYFSGYKYSKWLEILEFVINKIKALHSDFNTFSRYMEQSNE